MKRIGILGGSFDPLHNGHICIAKAAAEELSLEFVYLMPAYIQPFKQDRKVTSGEERLNMLNAAAEECEFIRISSIELEKEEVSYTYNTVLELKKKHPDTEIVFIMGADSLMTIEKWYRGTELLKLCSFAVGFRPGGSEKEKFKEKAEELRRLYGAKIHLLENRETDLSSTEIREIIARGEKATDLIPVSVERYIDEHRLYKKISK